jgi:hypothetical protein
LGDCPRIALTLFKPHHEPRHAATGHQCAHHNTPLDLKYPPRHRRPSIRLRPRRYAGTLLRKQAYFERRLADVGRRTGKKYTVVWQDYDTGAPITAQMMAGKIDIGSMGDYPLLINAARGQQRADTRTKLVPVTGYDARGALNSVVVAPSSPGRSLADLKGRTVSTSVGSAGHGLPVQAARRAGLEPATDFKTENQQPQVGASALRSGTVAALSQFVAWPGLLVFQGHARMLYDGGALGVPTLNGVVVRDAFATAHGDVVRASSRRNRTRAATSASCPRYDSTSPDPSCFDRSALDPPIPVNDDRIAPFHQLWAGDGFAWAAAALTRVSTELLLQ